jgi:hypothetical protein
MVTGPSSGQFKEYIDEKKAMESILRGEKLKQQMKKNSKTAINERCE